MKILFSIVIIMKLSNYRLFKSAIFLYFITDKSQISPLNRILNDL